MQRNEVAFKVAAKDIAYLTSGSSSAPGDVFGALVPDISSDVYKYVLFKYIISCPSVCCMSWGQIAPGLVTVDGFAVVAVGKHVPSKSRQVLVIAKCDGRAESVTSTSGVLKISGRSASRLPGLDGARPVRYRL